jgi:hypothetical protein
MAETTQSRLILKRGKVSRPSGQWGDDDYDVICEGAVVGRIFLLGAVSPPGRPLDVGERTLGGHDQARRARLRADARGGDGGVR